jgi:hypothetical protein
MCGIGCFREPRSASGAVIDVAGSDNRKNPTLQEGSLREWKNCFGKGAGLIKAGDEGRGEGNSIGFFCGDCRLIVQLVSMEGCQKRILQTDNIKNAYS